MFRTSETARDHAQRPQWFATTHWSVVLQAADRASPAAADALAKLCRIYWPPINAYLRRLGYRPHDAEDLTQQFFTRFLEKKPYLCADRGRGKFRTFLLTLLRNFLINEHERLHRKKRGGGQEFVSFDGSSGEEGAGLNIADERTAASIYERTWAVTLLAQVRERLRRAYTVEGKAERIEQLEKLFPGEEAAPTYAEVAARLGLAEGTIKSDMHWLKRRYGEVLREEIAHTVTSPAELEEELRYLLAVVSRPAV